VSLSKRIFIIALGFALILGALAWTWHRMRSSQALLISNAAPLRVLALRGVLDAAALEAFQAQTGVKLQIDEVESADEIWSRVLESTMANEPGIQSSTRLYDVIMIFSFQVQAAHQLSRIAPLERSQLANAAAISADFVDLPGDEDADRLAPLLWGMTGVLHNLSSSAPSPSWEGLFSGSKTMKELVLLGSPLDLLYVLGHRFPRSGATSFFEGDSNPDQGLEGVRAALNQLPAHVRISPSRSFQSEFANASSLPKDSAVQMSHGEAAWLVGEKEGLISPWQFFLPLERAPLWVLYLVIVDGTPRKSEAHLLIDYLLDPSVSLEIAKRTRQASGNARLERDQKVHPWIKPSHLRQVPLDRMQSIGEFHAGPAVRGLIHGFQNTKAPEASAGTK